MAKGSGYFKGEKKKQKKAKGSGFSATGGAPTYTMPEVIPNKKKQSSW